MIIGVDHIGWSLPSSAGAHRTLSALGYARVFAEPALPTAPAKAPLLRSPARVHAIEYWTHAAGPAIETIVHPGAAEDIAALPTVLIGGSGIGRIVEDGASADLAVLGIHAHRASLLPTRTTIFEAPDRPTGVAAYVVGAPDVDRARRVWCDALGARSVTEGAGSRLVRLVSPLPQWRLEIAIVGAPPTEPLHLDDEGFLSVGLLTTDLAGDRSRLEAVGVTMTEPFEMTVNGRSLRISMGRGAGTEILELIAVV